MAIARHPDIQHDVPDLTLAFISMPQLDISVASFVVVSHGINRWSEMRWGSGRQGGACTAMSSSRSVAKTATTCSIIFENVIQL